MLSGVSNGILLGVVSTEDALRSDSGRNPPLVWFMVGAGAGAGVESPPFDPGTDGNRGPVDD